MQVNRKYHGEKIKSCLYQPCFFNLLMIWRRGKAQKKNTGWVGYKVDERFSEKKCSLPLILFILWFVSALYLHLSRVRQQYHFW
jgi:hypothetical protein